MAGTMQSSQLSGFQLSAQQRHLWSLQTEHLYINQILLSMQGHLEIDRLQNALTTVVERHDSLRTIFCQPTTLTVPLQVVESQPMIAWKIADWGTETNRQQVTTTYRQRAVEAFQSLAQRPVVHATLGQQLEQAHWLLLSVPALCADTQSLFTLAQELALIYHHQTHTLIPADEVVQYPQFSAWQQELETDEDAETGLKFWSKIVHPPLKAPLRKRNVQASSTVIPHIYTVPIDDEIENHLTAEYPGTLLLAAWLVVLWKQTEKNDFTIGISTQNRSDEALENGLGAFQRHLPLQANLKPSISVAGFVQQLEQNWQQLEAWQDYFSSIKQPDIPDFEVGFEYLRVPAMSGNEVVFAVEQQWGYCDRTTLRLTCTHHPDHLQAELHYDPNVLSASTCQVLGDQWQAIATQMWQNPERAIRDLAISPHSALPTVPIVSSPANVTPLAHGVHQQFAQQAQHTPDHVAVVCDTQQLSYAALDQQANQLAHALRDRGAGPDVAIALYLDRSIEAIVAILAILKAGSAYVPLDPALPTAGLAHRLQDAQVPLVITQSALVERLPADSPQILCLDAVQDQIRAYPTDVPETLVQPDHLAYLIYTSGSTGRPKPVAVEHRHLTAYVHSVINRLQLPPKANYALVSTLAADLGHTMLFPSLSQGGTLHLFTAEQSRDSQAFADYSQQHQIDCLKIVPSHLQALLQGADPSHALPRQRLILGGEACRWSLIEAILALQPTCQIFNHYGPTETTVGVLTYPITAESLRDSISQTVPIGAPLDGVQIYLLDSELCPVGVGIPGELYIGGPTVSRGYLHQPQLTAERFITYLCPHASGAKSVRLYTTGDRARLLPDGHLEFLGRVDQQVKLHGFRIELGEIEAVLVQHESIKDAVAIVREDQPDYPLLVAYLVTTSGEAIDRPQLREYLQRQLPEYMIPMVFVGLKALPLTPNGKVNRAALPMPEKVRPELSHNFVAPRTDTEVAIAQIWCEVLQLETVGVTDNFFDLGGHSLLATQVLSRLREAFQIELPLRRLFDARTIEDTAAVIEAILIAEIEALSDEEAEEQLNAN